MHTFSISEQLFLEAQKHTPGGVNSPVRAFKSVGGTPVFFESAEGAFLKDVDGNSYIDYVGSWGPMLLGHAFPPVIDAVAKAAKNSTSFGAPTAHEIKMSQLIKKLVPGLELVRMVNSGTEACMSAIRLARGYTGRSKILKFEGCYHGHADSFLIKAGSGASTFGTPNSPGVTPATAADTLTATFNDAEEVNKIVEKEKDDLATIIVEPVPGNMGCIPPKKGFLQELRHLCDKHGIVLIFDEVMTGFRLAPGGAQELFGIPADLITYGKVIGAGLPVGAFGGKKQIMEQVSPTGPVYQAGTLSGNPVAMLAGIALLSEIDNNRNIYTQLAQSGEYLKKGLLKIFEKLPIPVQINQVGSMISVHFSDKPITNFQTAAGADMDKFKRFFHSLLQQGIYLPPSAFETWFISAKHTQNELDKTIAAAAIAAQKLSKQL